MHLQAVFHCTPKDTVILKPYLGIIQDSIFKIMNIGCQAAGYRLLGKRKKAVRGRRSEVGEV